MARRFHCPGPCHHFVRFRNGDCEYLGTATECPETEIEKHYLPLYTSLGGPAVEYQRVYAGEAHTVATTLNAFDYDVYRRLVAAMDPSAQGWGDNDDDALNPGMLALGSIDYELILAGEFGGTDEPAHSPGWKLPVGRRYWSTLLEGARETTKGTRVLEVALVFRCLPLYSTTQNRYFLYDDADLGPNLPDITKLPDEPPRTP